MANPLQDAVMRLLIGRMEQDYPTPAGFPAFRSSRSQPSAAIDKLRWHTDTQTPTPQGYPGIREHEVDEPERNWWDWREISKLMMPLSNKRDF